MSTDRLVIESKKNVNPMRIYHSHDRFQDAARCAWLGELDSQEESDEFSNEFDMQDILVYLQHFFKDIYLFICKYATPRRMSRAKLYQY